MEPRPINNNSRLAPLTPLTRIYGSPVLPPHPPRVILIVLRSSAQKSMVETAPGNGTIPPYSTRSGRGDARNPPCIERDMGLKHLWSLTANLTQEIGPSGLKRGSGNGALD